MSEEDRKLLELAAKAAGLDFYWSGKNPMVKIGPILAQYWNPRADDGNALRLAVKLKLDIYHYSRDNEPHVSVHDRDNRYGGFIEDYDGDANAATRRAIVRCAAEIGKALP